MSSPAAPSVPTVPSGLPTTAGELARSGHPAAAVRSVRTELRDNLLARLRDGSQNGSDPWPGIVGFDRTVLPQFERAVLAGHDVVLLGERGQGKTRLLRSLVGLLDEWTPVIAGSELGEHPADPITPASRRRVAELGDDLPITWRHRSERYAEKLATPDTSVADLIGDVDPVKVAEGRSLGDPETIHYGLVPRAHRGIVTINELPDLAERIQVALLNVMEERDIQVRGYTLRLPLDIMLVASANPEDYTNRGRIITPLKDRFGAEVRTHYPLEVAGEIALARQEAHLVAEVPDHLVEVLARFTRHLRQSSAVDQRSGVSARFTIAAAETVAAAALRRAAVTGEEVAVARPVDLESVPPVLRGKLEFESGEEGREAELLTHLLRRSITETARARLAGVDLTPLADGVSALEGSRRVVTGDRVAARQVVDALPSISVVYTVAERLGAAGTEAPGPLASAVELALEHLYLTRKLAKDSLYSGDAEDGTVAYGG
ncbi:ATP-binding protein [Actinomycetospora lutea]|uniref:ATP-binding protein n=1 Tax=Actinomycetospora lutea TaxID=663604 RepID=UPI002367195E|nr:ATP-binding protein [Actinomycetospora lutea]MDD7937406.1 ATP-binding protein [Actinomycetospora lutea]